MKVQRLISAIGIALLMLSGLSVTALAQTPLSDSSNSRHLSKPPKARISYGFRVGMGLSNFIGADAQGLDPRFTPSLGGVVTYGTDAIAFQTGLKLVQKGAKIDLGSGSIGIELSYLEIPLQLKFRNFIATAFGNQDNAERMLYLGPVVGINTSSKISASASGTSASVDIDNATSVVFGLAFGADASWKVGRTSKFYLDVCFNLGLTNPFSDVSNSSGNNFVNVDTGRPLDLGNLSLELLLGFGF
jgi:hypothetical protein